MGYHIVKTLQTNKIEVTLTQQTCPAKGKHGGDIEGLAFLVIFTSTESEMRVIHSSMKTGKRRHLHYN
jgi:hypothetical protein